MTTPENAARPEGYVRLVLTLTWDEMNAVADLLPSGTPILKNAIDLYHVGREKEQPLHLRVTEACAIFERLRGVHV